LFLEFSEDYADRRSIARSTTGANVGYVLAKMTLGSSASVPIEPSEYEAIREARLATRLGLSVEEKFDLVVEDYLELETTLLTASAHFMVLGGQDYQSFQTERALFNRRVVNLLAAGRTYTDHVPHHVAGLLATDNRASGRVKDAFSQQYDLRLGYRAMSALRNYVQHRELPVHAFGHNAKRVEGTDGVKFRYTTGLSIQPSELAADGSFKRSILRELEPLGEKVDLVWLIRDYVEGLWAAHVRIRDEIEPALSTHDGVIRAALARYEKDASEDPRHIAAWRETDRKTLADKQPIYTDGIDYRLHLRLKNATLVNLTARYASSETQSAGPNKRVN